jgi:DNA-binding MarR family transcriptional regulator
MFTIKSELRKLPMIDYRPSIAGNSDIFDFIISVRRSLEKPFEHCFKGEFTALQLNALCVLCVNGEMTMTELAANLHIQRQQMSRIIEKLYKDGHIVRTVHCNDRRKIFISVSDKTAAYIHSVREKFELVLKAELKNLNQSDYGDFKNAVGILNRILTRISENNIL